VLDGQLVPHISQRELFNGNERRQADRQYDRRQTAEPS
jgi:hypothetical protein